MSDRSEQLDAMAAEAPADDAYRTVNGFALDIDKCFISGCQCGKSKPITDWKAGDTLRTRIASVLAEADGMPLSDWSMPSQDGYLLRADAVIVELGLRREGGYPSRLRIAMQRRRPNPSDYRYRYVTDWKADDE